MESYHRYQRVESLILEELNKIILRELEFPADLVTVTSVQAQKDLEVAVINVSVLPTSKSEQVVEILNKNSKRLRFLLLRKINIKPMPILNFRVDYGPEKAAEVERVFLKIEKEEKGN